MRGASKTTFAIPLHNARAEPLIDEHQYRPSGRFVSAVAVGGWPFVSQQHQDFTRGERVRSA
jgi:hypothetical protein